MGREIPSTMIEHLDFIKSLDGVKAYYDYGERARLRLEPRPFAQQSDISIARLWG